MSFSMSENLYFRLSDLIQLSKSLLAIFSNNYIVNRGRNEKLKLDQCLEDSGL